MELPHIGQNCAESTCRQLDFLPVKCDACSKVFCREHMTYTTHNCPLAYKKNVQVPVCPLCNQPVPTPRGTTPDVSVGNHIDNDCRSDTAQSRRKVFINKCSMKKCHGKEMIRVVCSVCKLNFCLKHRHPSDHDCKGSKSSAPAPPRSKAAEAALARMTQRLSQHNISSDCRREASARPTFDQNRQMEEDEALARAIELSEREYAATNRNTRNATCSVS